MSVFTIMEEFNKSCRGTQMTGIGMNYRDNGAKEEFMWTLSDGRSVSLTVPAMTPEADIIRMMLEHESAV